MLCPFLSSCAPPCHPERSEGSAEREGELDNILEKWLYLLKVKPRTLLFALIALLPLHSCGNRAVSAQLGDIESYIQERPDSALAALQAIDTMRLAHKADKAHYQLLTAWALDKESVDDGRYLAGAEDAAGWYRTHGSKRHRMLAQYYYGDQQYDSGDLSGAILSFATARDLADALEDWFYAGMASRGIGNIYSSIFLHDDGLENYRNAFTYFDKAGYPEHSKYAKLQYAMESGNAGKNSQADSAYKEMLAINDDKAFHARCLIGYAYLCLRQDYFYPEKAYSSFKEAINEPYNHRFSAYSASKMAQACFSTGKKREGYSYIQKAKELALSAKDLADISYVEYVNERRDDDIALGHLEDVVSYVDSVFKEVCRQYANKALHEREKSELVIAETQVEKLHAKTTMILITGVLVLALLVLLVKNMRDAYRNRLNFTNYQLEQYQSAIEELEEKLRAVSSSVRADSPMNLFTQVLNNLCLNYYEPHTDKSVSLLKEFQDTLNRFAPGTELMNQFIASIDAQNNGLISLAENKIDNFTMQDCALLAYKIAGLSNTSMSLLMKTSKDNIATRIRRLKEKIEASGFERKSDILKHFVSYKKTNS